MDNVTKIILLLVNVQKMDIEQNTDQSIREDLSELLRGGFAPVVILLREYQFDKTSVELSGLPYSVWSLLEHMRRRQTIFLNFMKAPAQHLDIWPEAYWPINPVPENQSAWNKAIMDFEADLGEMIEIVNDTSNNLFEKHENGKTLFWAAVANLQHNAYHIGQIKAIGRQLGVW